MKEMAHKTQVETIRNLIIKFNCCIITHTYMYLMYFQLIFKVILDFWSAANGGVALEWGAMLKYPCVVCAVCG